MKLCLELKQRGEAEQSSPGFGGSCGALAAAGTLRRGCPAARASPAVLRRRAGRRSALPSPFLPRAAPAERLAAVGLELCNI